jgi:histidine triad (HIT) family protein
MATDCVFCELVANGPVLRTELDDVVRFEPLNPVTTGHMLFVPVRHRFDATTEPETTGRVFESAARYGRMLGSDFNLITSAGEDATQTVMHLHVHYVPRREGDGLPLPWTPQQLAAGQKHACEKAGRFRCLACRRGNCVGCAAQREPKHDLCEI